MRVPRRHTSPPDCLLAAALTSAICLMMACQDSPTEPGQLPDGTQVDSVGIVAPSTLLVHDVALLSAKVWTSRPTEFELPITWKSSDPSIASLSPSGEASAVLTAHRTGPVTIIASAGDFVGEFTLRVTAQLRIQPDYLYLPNGWPMAVGDQLQLEVVYADVNGETIAEIPSVTWSSTDPDGVSVSPAGLVAAAQANHLATVTATSPDGTVSVLIRVLDVLAGQPATVRIVHGVPGVGPVRFQVSQGGSLSLSYAESVELPILSGTLLVSTEGLPRGNASFGDPNGRFVGIVRPGDHLSLYAAGNPELAYLQPAWAPPTSISPDSGLVRLVQSSPVMVVSLRESGAPISGLPELCYFDPGVVSDYFVRAAGDFDIIGQDKYENQQEIGRVAGSVAGGQAVTMVLTGGGRLPFRVLTFADR